MPYVLLSVAIAAEIVAISFLKYSNGFRRLIPTLICILFYSLCHITFGKAVMRLNLGMAYAIWCGVGILATTLISVCIFKEKISLPGVAGLLFIIIGGILLNLSGTK